MPNPPNCPECEEKVILNGGVAEKVLGETCYTIKRFVDKGGKFSDPLKLVQMANKLEDDAFAFQKEVLTQMGFQGPWPKSMS
jgi:hypothetical protein